MRTTTDEEMVARGGRVGQVAIFIALVMVGAGLVVSFTPWKTIAVILVGLGVVMYTIGNRQLSQAAREPRLIEQVVDALKGFDDRYHLYNHILPGDHVLLTPGGLFVLAVKGVDGRIRCFKDKWVRDFSLGRLLRFFTEESLGNPTKDAQRELEKVRKYIEEHNPEADVDVQGLVVFVNPKARLEVTGASLPVLPLRRLRTYIRKASQQREIPLETLAALTTLFDEAPRI
jgi:plasmid stabilization system protein ParE